ncbi:Uncharacterised protein [Mycobacteroides abscessus subsp. abscessus]|nr:Uncharacterised protein [Mycobacteroides abscessus subsp. abscessus]
MFSRAGSTAMPSGSSFRSTTSSVNSSPDVGNFRMDLLIWFRASKY